MSKIILNGVYGPALKKFKLHDPEESTDRTEKLHKNALKHAHNLTVHLLTLLFGIRALAGKDWVPWYMGGSGPGQSEKIFPNFPFCPIDHEVYLVMLASLGLPLQNLIELLFINERTPDFPEMLLHHICHFNLIFMCLIANYTNIGILVLLCHSASDIFL